MVKKDDESTFTALQPLQLMFDEGQMRDPGEKIPVKTRQ
jgi:hypothetical protein